MVTIFCRSDCFTIEIQNYLRIISGAFLEISPDKLIEERKMSGFTFRKEPIIQMTEVLPLLNLPLFDGNDSAFLAIKAGAV